MYLPTRWTWCFFLLLAAAAAFPLSGLPRVAMLSEPLGLLYLPLKLLIVLVVLTNTAIAAFLIVYGRGAATALSPRPVPPPPDALTLGWDPQGSWICLTNRALQHHVLLLGSSGSGKTQLLLSLLAQQIQRGGGGLMIDAKVDRSALQTIVALCREADRLEDLRVLWPPSPRISHSWNPLLRGSIQEVLSRVMALWGTGAKGEAEFWRGSAHTVLHAVLGAMIRINPRVTFNDLYLALTSADALLWLERTVPPGTEEASALTAFLSNFRNQQGRLNVDHLKRMTGGVPQYLSAYAWGDLGQIMNHTGPSLDILEALTDGQIVYVALPILARTEEATAMARMLIADLKQAVGALQQRIDKPRVPFLVLMDEASSYTNVDGVERLFEQARSAGVALVAAAQVVSGFATAGKAQQDFIMGNTTTKVIMTLGDFPSAEAMAKTVGEEIVLFGSATHVAQKSRSAAWISPMPDRASKGQSEARGTSERYDYVIRPEQFMQQRTGEAVIYIRDPLHGSTLHPNARMCFLDLPPAPPENLPAVARNNPRGLGLLEAMQRGTITPLAEPPKAPARTTGSGRAPTRPIRRRETQDFTVVEPTPSRGPEEA